tara:strand:+ start:246 stop:401 length:156 start_codon:yes stop_codon:yes gene_type:complete
MKLRYWFGIPYLFMVTFMGANPLMDALVIGFLCGLTDIYIQGGGSGPRFGG